MRLITVLLVAMITIVVASPSLFAQGPASRSSKLESTPKLPTARQVVASYIKAIGGHGAVKKIKSRRMKGTVEMRPMGLKGTFESVAAAGNRSHTKMTIAGIGDLLEGYDGKVGWAANPLQGNREKTGDELEQAKVLNEFYRDIRLDKIYPTMELKGVEKFGGKDAYVVRAEPAKMKSDTLYFDVTSGLLLGMDTEIVAPEGNQPAKIFYEQYRSADGVMIPFKTRTVMQQFEIVLNVTEIKSNVPVDDAKFARPTR